LDYKVSEKHLLKNAQAALLAAIEIYNKPQFNYRDECVVILLLNAWELLLKALIVKKGASIFYEEQPDRTLSCTAAFNMATTLISINNSASVKCNLDLLGEYRDNSIHFYNEEGFGVIIYSLAQKSITDFNDLLNFSFSVDLSNEINLALLPLSLNTPIDPITFISGKKKEASSQNPVLSSF